MSFSYCLPNALLGVVVVPVYWTALQDFSAQSAATNLACQQNSQRQVSEGVVQTRCQCVNHLPSGAGSMLLVNECLHLHNTIADL